MNARFISFLSTLCFVICLFAFYAFGKSYGTAYLFGVTGSILYLWASILNRKIAVIPPFLLILKCSWEESRAWFIVGVILHILFISFLIFSYVRFAPIRLTQH